MCGIFGVISSLPQSERKFLKSALATLGKENVFRGYDAYGYAYFNENGRRIVHKEQGSWYNALDTEDWKNLKVPSIFIGHTRAATQGEPDQNENNHPLSMGDFTVVHNGVLWNDEELTKELSLHRNAEVDSEVIVSLIHRMRRKNPKLAVAKLLQESLKLIEGSHACALIDNRQRDNLYLWRKGSPLYAAYLIGNNTIAFSSTSSSLKSAFSDFVYEIKEIPENRILVIRNKGERISMSTCKFDNFSGVTSSRWDKHHLMMKGWGVYGY